MMVSGEWMGSCWWVDGVVDVGVGGGGGGGGGGGSSGGSGRYYVHPPVMEGRKSAREVERKMPNST